MASGGVFPSPQRLCFCQLCRVPLDIIGTDALFDSARQAGGQPSGGASRMAMAAMDSSFVLLPKQQRPPAPLPSSSSNAPTLPPRILRPSSTAMASAGGAFTADFRGAPAAAGISTGGGAGGDGSAAAAGFRGMEESFVVLPSAAASMYRHEGGQGGPGPQGDGGGSHGSLDSRIMALTKVFELASQHTGVDHPLCAECMRSLQEELSMEVRDVEKDIAGYEACLLRFEAEEQKAMKDDKFAWEKQQAEAEEQRLFAELTRVQAERAEVRAELAEVEKKAVRLEELQQRYWHEWNELRWQLTVHQEARDTVLARMEVAGAQLEALKSANVLNDAFHIWHDGEFGTINSFRLGRLPSVPVEWDEINAAWGQACLLLFTMAQMCRFTFSYRILPMGSQPRIADGKNSYDLFGPVNLFWSTRYDKAMVLFLACLKEFTDFAHAKDRAADIPPEKCFQLPYRIDGDKVKDLTIKQSFNRDERWTKALKYTLCDLKWALVWLINNGAPPPSQQAASAPQGPSSSNLTMVT